MPDRIFRDMITQLKRDNGVKWELDDYTPITLLNNESVKAQIIRINLHLIRMVLQTARSHAASAIELAFFISSSVLWYR